MPYELCRLAWCDAFALALSFPGESRYVVVSATIVTVLISSLPYSGGLTAPLVRMLKISDNRSGGHSSRTAAAGGSGCLDDNDTNCHGLSTSASSLSSPTYSLTIIIKAAIKQGAALSYYTATATDSRQQPLLKGDLLLVILTATAAGSSPTITRSSASATAPPTALEDA